MAQKPITMIMDEFKASFVDLLNNANMPAWLILQILSPFMDQLRQLDEQQKAEERVNYERELEEERMQAENVQEEINGTN